MGKLTRYVSTMLAVVFFIAGLVFAIHGLSVYGWNSTTLNLLGDYLGGTTGSFWAAASLLLVYLGFDAQKRANDIQQSEIDRSKAELARRDFESSFYLLLKIHLQTVSQIDITIGGRNSNRYQGKDCIRLIVDDIRRDTDDSEGITELERAVKAMERSIKKYSLDYTTYFGGLRPLMTLLQRTDSFQKDEYEDILLCQLSDYECAFVLIYSQIDSYFKNFALKHHLGTRASVGHLGNWLV